MVAYSDKVAALICERMAAGKSLSQVCRMDDMPAKPNVLRWLREKPEFRTQYEEARADLLEHWADEIVDISDDTTKDTHTTVYEGGAERVSPNTEWISRARLRVDSRKWLMSKLAPRKYGDKIEQQHSGAVKTELVVNWQSSKSSESK